MDAPLQPGGNRRAFEFMTMWNWYQETRRALEARRRANELPSAMEVSNYLDLRNWARESGTQSVLDGLAPFEDLVRGAAQQRERPRDEGELIYAQRVRQHFTAEEMQRGVRLLFGRGTAWVWKRRLPNPLPPGHVLLFRFANVLDASTLRGKLYSENVQELEQEVNRLHQLALGALRKWQQDKSKENLKEKNEADAARKAAERRFRAVRDKLRQVDDPQGRIDLAIRHAGGQLQDYSPFASLAQDPVPFILSDNKVAQSIVRNPLNYVPNAEFNEYPEPARNYRQAPYIVMMLVPEGELITPEQIKNAMSAESDVSIIIQVGEHLYYRPDLERYVIAYAANPF